MQAIRREDVAFSSTERDRHLGIRPVSQLNTQPVVSPVNASSWPSRQARITRGRGGWLGLTPWGTFTSYPLPACPGALRVGSCASGWPHTDDFRSTYKLTSLPCVGMSQMCRVEMWRGGIR